MKFIQISCEKVNHHIKFKMNIAFPRDLKHTQLKYKLDNKV